MSAQGGSYVLSFPLLPTPVAFEETGVLRPFDSGAGAAPLLNVIETDQPAANPQVWFNPPAKWPSLGWRSQSRPGRGLLNSRNVCFLNATTQAMAYCPPFAEDCFRHRHSRHCFKRRNRELCAFCAVETLVCHLFRRAPVSPSEDVGRTWNSFLKLASRKISMGGERGWLGQEQCAHEWLTHILEWLVECDMPDQDLAQKFTRFKFKREDLQTTYIQQLFAFELAEEKVCNHCRTSSTQYETHYSLRASGSKTHLLKGLTSFFEEETMTGGNRPFCYRCGTAQAKVARRVIRRPPNILCIMVDRAISAPLGAFARWTDTRRVKKAAHPLRVPHAFSLAPFISGDGRPVPFKDEASSGCQPESSDFLPSEKASSCAPSVDEGGDDVYTLCSAVCHSGTVHSGHYWAVVRGPHDRWYTINDETVREVGWEDARRVLTAAYLLFYARKRPVDLVRRFGLADRREARRLTLRRPQPPAATVDEDEAAAEVTGSAVSGEAAEGRRGEGALRQFDGWMAARTTKKRKLGEAAFCPEERMQGCKSVTSQFSAIFNVGRWDSNDNDEAHSRADATSTNVGSASDFEAIQRSLLPQTTQRNEHDKRLDLGRQKKVKDKAKFAQRRAELFGSNAFTRAAERFCGGGGAAPAGCSPKIKVMKHLWKC